MSPSAQPDALAKPAWATWSRRGQCRGAHSLAAARLFHPLRKVCRFGPCLLRGTPRATEPIEPVRRARPRSVPGRGSIRDGFTCFGPGSRRAAHARREPTPIQVIVVVGVLAAGVRTLSLLSGGAPSVLRLQVRTWVRLRRPRWGTRHTPRASQQSASSGPGTLPVRRPRRGRRESGFAPLRRGVRIRPSPAGCAPVQSRHVPV